MTKASYMALADFQDLWTNTVKPYIVAGFIAMLAGTDANAKNLVLADGTNISQSTFQAAGDYIEALGSSETGHDNLLLADGTNIAQSTFIPATEKGSNSGVATLDSNGKVPSSQLPSFVDDVIDLLEIAATAPAECATGDKYYNSTSKKIFTATGTNTWSETGDDPEGGKIYITLDDEKTYRWSGTTMAEISAGLALGETQGTAYEGSKGAANALAITALQSDKANKSEMAVTDGEGANADKVTITLKTGTEATVLKTHQDISGKADKIAATAFSDETAYTVGDYVTYSGNLYKCTTAHAAGAWNAEDFTLATNDFVALDANGNVKDSGKKASDFATAAQGAKADSAIQGIKVNGTAQTPDSGNVVDIEMPERVTAAELATFVV